MTYYWVYCSQCNYHATSGYHTNLYSREFFIERRKTVEIGLLNYAHSKLAHSLKTGVSKLGYTDEISKLNEEYETLKTFSAKLVGHGSTPWSKRPSFYINTILAVISPVILQMDYTLVEKFLHGIIS